MLRYCQGVFLLQQWPVLMPKDMKRHVLCNHLCGTSSSPLATSLGLLKEDENVAAFIATVDPLHSEQKCTGELNGNHLKI